MSKPKKTPIHEQLASNLKKLRLCYLAEHFQEVIDAQIAGRLSLLEAFANVIAEEAAHHEERALLRRIRSARLPREKRIEDYDFDFPKRIARQKLLRYFDLDFVSRQENLVLIGNQGLGKTHILTAMGYAACRLGITVRFARTVDMINKLIAAQQEGTLGKALRTYTRPQLLLLDELGYLPIDKRGADLMFQVVAARYETGSIVLTTNRSFKDWGTIFDIDTTLASAIIDRLMHHGEAIVIEGKSYRVKDRDIT